MTEGLAKRTQTDDQFDHQHSKARRVSTATVVDDESLNHSSAVAVRRQGTHAWIRVTGQVTGLTRRHLDDWLDWLITHGAKRVTVALATAEQIDEDCLLVLRVAKARLRGKDGELLVTAGRVQVRDAVARTGARSPRVGRLHSPTPAARQPAASPDPS